MIQDIINAHGGPQDLNGKSLLLNTTRTETNENGTIGNFAFQRLASIQVEVLMLSPEVDVEDQ